MTTSKSSRFATPGATTVESPMTVLWALEDEEFDLDVVDGHLRVRPAHELTESHRAAIRRHRDDLIVLVQGCDPGVLSRRVLFRRQWTLDGTTTFLVCPDLGWERGQCFSCGDELGAPRYGRCWRCHLAWRWAAGLFDRMVDGRTTQTVTDEDEVA